MSRYLVVALATSAFCFVVYILLHNSIHTHSFVRAFFLLLGIYSGLVALIGLLLAFFVRKKNPSNPE